MAKPCCSFARYTMLNEASRAVPSSIGWSLPKHNNHELSMCGYSHADREGTVAERGPPVCCQIGSNAKAVPIPPAFLAQSTQSEF